MVDKKKLVKIITKNQILKKKFEAIIGLTEGFEVQPEGEDQPADLLIFELGSDPDYDFEVVQSLLQSGVAQEVFLTAEKSDPDLLLKAIRVGAREFISQPIKDEEVKDALKKFRQGIGSFKRMRLSRVINVVGSKGGVGTTTVAVNIATSLAEIGEVDSVALVDMNLATPEIPLFLNLRPGYHWGKIAQNITRLDSTFMMSILNKHNSGVYAFASSRISDQETVSPEVIERVINILRRMFSFVVIDSGGIMEPTYRRIL
ncbi:MAG: P-loop NTPase, partial [Desulfobacterota bacterium]|nr:P-loop NTPase [Thermodesulfobacteriota bacterium]